MKITVSNKTASQKPTKAEMGKFFDNRTFSFQTVEAGENDIKTIIENGYVLTYLFNDTHFKRGGNYMKTNYKGTQFICIDVDRSEKNAQELINMMEYKPTFYHTTYSHKKEVKDYLNCYHFYYCLDKVVENEGNFNNLFSEFSKGIEDYVDNQAKDCHRCIFTTHKSDSVFEYMYYGDIYNPDSILSTNSTLLPSFSEYVSDTTLGKNELSVYILHTTDIFEQAKFSQPNNEESVLTNYWHLDETFFDDYNRMSRGDFVFKYCDVFEFYTSTPITSDMYNEDGYAELRGMDYYEVPSAQYRWDETLGKATIKKIENGHRDTMLWLDGLAFTKIIPNITKEQLIYCLTREVYEHYMNGDKELNKRRILEKAKQVWESKDKANFKPVKKSFKINMGKWYKRGFTNTVDIVQKVKKIIKTKDILSCYDFSQTVEWNVKELKKYGINTKKETVIKRLVENGFTYVTEKEYRNSMILYYYKEDNTRSSRDIEKLCKDNGISVSYKTVQSVITTYNVGKK